MKGRATSGVSDPEAPHAAVGGPGEGPKELVSLESGRSMPPGTHVRDVSRRAGPDWGELSAEEFVRAHVIGAASRCPVSVHLDGRFVGLFTPSPRTREQRIGNSELMARVGFYATGELEGVEIYREGSFNPPDLSGCQIVGIWSQRGR